MQRLIPAIIMSALLLPGASALAQSQSGKQGEASNKQAETVTIERSKPKDAMLDLRTAVRDLRQASVNLLNEKQSGEKRQKAFQSAQDAIAKAQGAMAQLTPNTQTAIKHDSKSWPVVAARLDRAAAALQAAVDNLSKQSGDKQSQAAQSAQAALDEVKDAVHNLPNMKVGANDK